ncbi:unnamed protein product [Prorocentrum cordatum]|uniref:Secreted protein n=1 Tax=Prorocentrum cordatum TaxID=2364126 RepID=A0ABN9WQS5_9DINO|nr:unnamed protein product [Polarella glacialis]|mmetsp:Transcript_42081/g.109590  ORF Transcript_42081/g.109590 Transcript_42081/m.109590 type:complete len:133 (+) Transcript_42081:121-519(+)
MGIWRLLLLILFFDAIFKVMVAGVMYSSPGDLVFGKGDSTRVGRVKGHSYIWQHRQLIRCSSTIRMIFKVMVARRMYSSLGDFVLYTLLARGTLPGSEESKANRTDGSTGNSHCASAGLSMVMISSSSGSVL